MCSFRGRSTSRTSSRCSRITAASRSEVSLLAAIVILFLTYLPHHISEGLVLNPIERILFQKRLDSIRSSIEQRNSNSNDKDDRKVLLPNFDASILSKRKGGILSSVDVDIVLIFPGAGGPDQFTDELQSVIRNITAFREENGNSNTDGKVTRKTMVHTFDWTEYRGSPITAAFDGEAVGEAVAHSLWKEKHELDLATDKKDGAIGLRLRSVHSIGISVGAFASQAFASTICQLRDTNENIDDPEYVRLTLLDPFCSRGIWGINYGAKHFGTGGIDYAEQYLNTDDPVPTTNDPLPLCACFDVTGAPERDSFVLPEGETMHCWPLVYFARCGYKTDRRLYHGVAGIQERGSVEKK